MKISKSIYLILMFILVSCKEASDEEIYYNEINNKTVKFLDKADRELKPCLDSIKNPNSSDMAIVVNCQTAVFLYRKYGGHDHLAPLYLTVTHKKDILRSQQLVIDLDMINNKFYQLEARNKDNMYFQQVILTQKIAQDAADFGKIQVGETVPRNE